MAEDLVVEYRVRTQEQWDWLMKHLEDTTELQWGTGGFPTALDYWETHEEETRVFAGGELSYGKHPYWGDSESWEVSDLMGTDDESEVPREVTRELEETISHQEMVELLDIEEEEPTTVLVECYGEEEGMLEVMEFWANYLEYVAEIGKYFIYFNDTLLASYSVEQVARIHILEGEDLIE